MKSYECQLYPYPVVRGTVVIVTKQDRSYNNGRTWTTVTEVSPAMPDEVFRGDRGTMGPSMSGFWGNCNEIRSGSVDKYCSRYDGKRWITLK
jgi:hypothetical protein